MITLSVLTVVSVAVLLVLVGCLLGYLFGAMEVARLRGYLGIAEADYQALQKRIAKAAGKVQTSVSKDIQAAGAQANQAAQKAADEVKK